MKNKYSLIFILIVGFLLGNQPILHGLGVSKNQDTNDYFIFSRYLGGKHDDVDVSYSDKCNIILDNSGNIIFTGATESRDYPALNGFDDTYNGYNIDDYDGFITKLSNNGSILWSTFLGGDSYESINGVIIDEENAIIVTGRTASDNFPILNPPLDEQHHDIFLTKFSSHGVILWSTFFGGSYSDFVNDIANDSQNNVIITGGTTSDDFPTKNAFDNTNDGSIYSDVFLTKITPEGDILFSTFIGGKRNEEAYQLTVDNDNCIILTGYTTSQDFPIINAFDMGEKPEYLSGTIQDAFIIKFDPTGEVLWSTRIGESTKEGFDTGSIFDIKEKGKALTVDDNNDIYLYIEAEGSKSITKLNSNGKLVWNQTISGIEGYTLKPTNSGNKIVLMGATTERSKDVYLKYYYASNGNISGSISFGGDYNDFCMDGMFDNQGRILLGGWTNSENFPSTINTGAGEIDGFVSYLKNPRDFPSNVSSSENHKSGYITILSQITFVIIIALWQRKRSRSLRSTPE